MIGTEAAKELVSSAPARSKRDSAPDRRTPRRPEPEELTPTTPGFLRAEPALPTRGRGQRETAAPSRGRGHEAPARLEAERAGRIPATAPAAEHDRRAPRRPRPEETTPTGRTAALEAVEPQPVEATVTLDAVTDLAEKVFADRVAPPAAERVRPNRRRAIFIDVENTSRASRVEDALAVLAIDHGDAATDIVASGNWRVIGNETARLLAAKGAHLVHSAPATGVRDWSDLRIAVAAGVWLASSRPGDRLEIVSDDRAFDAVGDVAASLGVEYHRLSYRTREREAAAVAAPRRRGGAERPPRPPREPREPREQLPRTSEETAASVSAEGPGRSRRRRGRGRSTVAAALGESAQLSLETAGPAAEPSEEITATAPAGPPHGAAKEDLLQVVSELIVSSPRGVSLDALANRLKALGFARPPGSPRLVTRVRAIDELSVSPNGMIRLASSEPLPGEAAEGAPSDAPEGGEPVAAGEQGEGAPGRSRPRRRRRGGGGRRPPQQA